MVNLRSNVGALFLAAALLTACSHSSSGVTNHELIDTIDHAPIQSGTYALTGPEVGNIIAKAAIGRGWTVAQVKPGKLHLHIERRKTFADADVSYDKNSYSITLTSPQNASADKNFSAADYNRYIDYLKRDIDKDLNEAVFQ